MMEIALVIRWLEDGEYRTERIVGVTEAVANEILETLQTTGSVTITVTLPN